MKTLFAEIVQTVMYGKEPYIQEFGTDEANHRQPSHWWLQWANERPNHPWYVYSIHGVHIGLVFGEEASYTTLVEFVDNYRIVMNSIWHDYLDEASCYLLDRGIYD